VTVAGIVFGHMRALLTSSVLSVAQIGTTVAVGLLLDTLVVRAFIVPSIVALFGRWFWCRARCAVAPSRRARKRLSRNWLVLRRYDRGWQPDQYALDIAVDADQQATPRRQCLGPDVSVDPVLRVVVHSMRTRTHGRR
jgi:hypothetical protein